MDKRPKTELNNDAGDDMIIGRNAVLEAIKNGRQTDTVYVASGERTGSIGMILGKARELGIVIKEVDRRKLDAMCGGANHQGIAARASAI